MSHSDQVKHRHVMPKTFVPERISGYEVLGKRTRETYSSASTPQPSSSSSPAPNSVALLTPTPSRHAPPVASTSAASHPSTGGKTFTGEGSGFQPVQPRGWASVYDADIPPTQEEQIANIQAEAAESALAPKESAPEPKSLVIVLKCDLTKLRNHDSALPLDSPAPKRRRLNANAANRVYMDAAEIARQEATFTPTTAGGVGYAAPGVVRQVRMERGGEFTEEEVLYGCRMLV